MRALVATGISVALAGVASGARAREASIYRGTCGEVVLPSGPTGLDSALRIRTACGAFVVDRDGVRYTGPYRLGPKWDGLMARRGRLVLYRRGRIVWRSLQKRYGVPGWVVEDKSSFAFMGRTRLYVAELDGPERAVGRLREYPLGWTRAGLLVTSQEHVLRARTRSGRLVHILDDHALNPVFDPRSSTLLYITESGALVRTDGHRSQTLKQGIRRRVDIRPLEQGRVALIDRRLVVLGPDGSVLASDRRRYNFPALTSRGAIAMIATERLNAATAATDESVRLLRPGERSSTVLYTAKVGALGCGHWPTLAWRGDELLYSTSEGHVVVMKPSSGGQLDLTAVVRRLPGEFLEAAWS